MGVFGDCAVRIVGMVHNFCESSSLIIEISGQDTIGIYNGLRISPSIIIQILSGISVSDNDVFQISVGMINKNGGISHVASRTIDFGQLPKNVFNNWAADSLADLSSSSYPSNRRNNLPL